jgi:hypothetical protein
LEEEMTQIASTTIRDAEGRAVYHVSTISLVDRSPERFGAAYVETSVFQCDPDGIADDVLETWRAPVGSSYGHNRAVEKWTAKAKENTP